MEITNDEKMDSLLIKFISEISSTFKLSVNDLIKDMKFLYKETELQVKKNVKRIKNIDMKCIHRIKSGEKRGKPCGKPPSKDSITGKYCGIHLKQESSYSSILNQDKQNVLRNLYNKKPSIILELNEYGNYEHTITHLIFNDSKKVIGIQKGDKVAPLSKEDIEQCKEYYFDYDIPESLRDDEIKLEFIDIEEEEEEEE